MVKIYLIEDCNGLKYVGSTKRTLKTRLCEHRCHNQCMSRELNLNDCKIYVLEECDEKHRKVREQYWINNTECVNKYNTIFDRKEYFKQYDKIYQQENREKLSQKKKIYNQENRDKMNKQMNNYYHYNKTWGGDPRFNNNLLKINLDIFL